MSEAVLVFPGGVSRLGILCPQLVNVVRGSRRGQVRGHSLVCLGLGTLARTVFSISSTRTNGSRRVAV